MRAKIGIGRQASTVHSERVCGGPPMRRPVAPRGWLQWVGLGAAMVAVVVGSCAVRIYARGLFIDAVQSVAAPEPDEREAPTASPP